MALYSEICVCVEKRVLPLLAQKHVVYLYGACAIIVLSLILHFHMILNFDLNDGLVKLCSY